MSTPRWGHKPPPVTDRYAYWSSAPAEPSDRMAYWARRYRMGEWDPNRWVRRQGYDSRAGMLGVWIWEGNGPVMALMRLAEGLIPDGQIAAYAAVRGASARYWALLEERSRHGWRDPDQSWRDDRFGFLVDALEEQHG